MSFVSMHNVCKSYKMGEVIIHASDHVNFSVEQGEFVVIVGASGAGKTTVLNMLGGMDRADSGEILVDNRDITQFSRKQLAEYRRYDIGFVFQFYNLINNLTARENVELAVQICKNAMAPDEALERVGLGERKKNFPSQLSGGEQQRVSIARALAKRPKLLLCDEPTGALDDVTGRTILKLLQDTCKDSGITIMVITHNSAVTPMADRVIRMKNSQVESITQNPSPVSAEQIEW